MTATLKRSSYPPCAGKAACPLVVLFSTPTQFCLLIAGHRLFDAQQQAVIAEMPPTNIRFVWDKPAETASLCIGREAVSLTDGDIAVYRFDGPSSRRGIAETAQDADWNALRYAVFTGKAPDEQVWQPTPFTLSELCHHDEFARLTCRGAVLSGLGNQIRGGECHE